jgi:hypothetical protein
MTYVDTDGTSVNHNIPVELGGIYLYCDGPVSAAGSNIGTAVWTWTLEYKGVRMDNNVVTALADENQLMKLTIARLT